MMSMKLAAIVAAAALATGCATHRQTGQLVGGVVGAAIGGPIGSTAAAQAGGALLGGAVGYWLGGSIGKTMDKHDHMMVEKSVTSSTTQTWTSSSGTVMKAESKEVAPDKKEVTVTAGDKVETTTVIKKQGKWVKE